MIFDYIDCLAHYSLLIPKFKYLSDYLASNDINKLELGKHSILNNDLFIIVSEYETNEKDIIIWESHKRFIDIHLVLKGTENIGFVNIKSLVIEEPYNYDKDVTIYNKQGDGQYIELSPGMFCIFFPEECHKPSCITKSKQTIRKAVIKVNVKEE